MKNPPESLVPRKPIDLPKAWVDLGQAWVMTSKDCLQRYCKKEETPVKARRWKITILDIQERVAPIRKPDEQS